MTLSRDRMAWLLAATMVAIVVAGPSARGQDDEAEELRLDVVPGQIARDDLVRLQRQRRLTQSRRQLDGWISARFKTLFGLRDHLETQLGARLDDLHFACQLSELQRKKLQVAGRGDIKRFLDRVDDIRKVLNDEPDDREAQAASAALRDLQEDVEKPFDHASLFSKTLATTLTPEQVAQNERYLRDKNLVRYRDAVNQTVRRLARLLNLNARQRDELSSMILAETTAPTRFGQSDYAFVMFQASTVPEAKLRAIFHEGQWNAIKQQLASWADAEKALRDEGFEFRARPKGNDPKARQSRVGT